MYGYFANKSKHRLIIKNMYKNMAIYLKNRRIKRIKVKLQHHSTQKMTIYLIKTAFRKKTIFLKNPFE